MKNRQHNLVTSQTNSVGLKNEKTSSSSAATSNLKRSHSQDSVYTILIRLPMEGTSSSTTGGGGGSTTGNEAARNSSNIEADLKLPSIKMFTEDPTLPKMNEFGTLKRGDKDHFGVNPMHHSFDYPNSTRLPMNAKIVPKKPALTQREKQQQKAALNKKKKSQEKRQESKAAKTLSAILLSFIITWTPYNILVLIKPITTCTKCIPQELWDFFYALCYINR
jgi:muscarinic acetylcholine receptor M3